MPSQSRNKATNFQRFFKIKVEKWKSLAERFCNISRQNWCKNFSIRNITQIISLLNQINLINQFGSVSDMEIWKVCNQIITKNKHKFNPLSGNSTKWSNTKNYWTVSCCRRIVWLHLTILWGWHLKGKIFFVVNVSKSIVSYQCNLILTFGLIE